MFIDSQGQLSAAQAVTVSAVSTNAYDLGAPFSGGTSNGAAIDPSVGEPMCVVVVPTVSAKVSVTDETYEFDIVTATNTNLTTAQDIVLKLPFTNTQAGTLLVAGQVLVVPLPAGRITQRFVGLKYITAGTGPTITVNAWIAPLSMVQQQKFYTSAIVVS